MCLTLSHKSSNWKKLLPGVESNGHSVILWLLCLATIWILLYAFSTCYCCNEHIAWRGKSNYFADQTTAWHNTPIELFCLSWLFCWCSKRNSLFLPLIFSQKKTDNAKSLAGAYDSDIMHDRKDHLIWPTWTCGETVRFYNYGSCCWSGGLLVLFQVTTNLPFFPVYFFSGWYPVPQIIEQSLFSFLYFANRFICFSTLFTF